jgi:bacteriorhodopsin
MHVIAPPKKGNTKKMSLLVWTSNQISLLVQFITGIAGIYGLTIPLSPQDSVLHDVLTLEMIVQTIEFIFYLGFLTIFNLVSLTQARYYDWFLSTPIMLFTTSLYFYYKNFIENDQDSRQNNNQTPFNIKEFIKTHYVSLFAILLLNFLMLLFGFLAELGIMNRSLAFVLGTSSLIGSFSIMYQQFGQFSLHTRTIFYSMFVLWSLYGVFFLMSPVIKNLGYTILDIFAKNFFGLFLTYLIYQKKIHYT